MKPFYFGSSDKPLFGIHHEPTALPGIRRSEGIVLCHPFGREYLRAHRAMRELALRLAVQGFPVLRFDYFGCGDSSGDGEEASVDQWVRDVGAAAAEMRDASGFERVSLVGARFGAALAVLAAREEVSIARLVLWDPVLDGRRYVRELVATQAAWVRAHPIAGKGHEGTDPAAPEKPFEVLGFPLTEALAEGFARIDPEGLGTPSARQALVIGGALELDPSLAAWRRILEAASKTVTFRSLSENHFWLRQDGINQAIVPSAAIAAIADFFTAEAQ